MSPGDVNRSGILGPSLSAILSLSRGVVHGRWSICAVLLNQPISAHSESPEENIYGDAFRIRPQNITSKDAATRALQPLFRFKS